VTGVAGGLFDEMEENPPQVDPGMPWAMTSVQKVRPTYDLVGPGCPDAIGVDHLVRARTLLGMLQNDGVLLNDPPAPDCGCGGYRWGLFRGMVGPEPPSVGSGTSVRGDIRYRPPLPSS
jgi:hypothetical protein